MITRFTISLMILFALTAGIGQTAPSKGAYALKPRVPAKAKMEFEETFQGGRRACVIAVGDHRPVVDIAIEVYDSANRKVAADEGIDYAAAIWYPPREEKYKIVVRNYGQEYNEMYLVFK